MLLITNRYMTAERTRCSSVCFNEGKELNKVHTSSQSLYPQYLLADLFASLFNSAGKAHFRL